MMSHFTCTQCQREFSAEELPRRGEICFACHVRGVNLGFTHGRDNFHGDTIAEKQRQIVSNAAAKGITAEPVTNWM